jgi:molybdate transport system regulatory protein
MATPFIDALGHGAGDKRIEILRGIAATGSISQAAREAGVSYKAAWQAIDTLTNLAGVALVQRAVGGAGGGGAVLTAQGTRLLGLAQAFDAARREVHARWLAEHDDGEGAAGPVATAPVRDGGGRNASATGATLSRLALRTSMRNQLPAVVEQLATTGRIVRVSMRLEGTPAEGPRLVARITRESAELLGLRPGLPVIALCKATAVRIGRAMPQPAPAEPDAQPHGIDVTHLEGSVARVSRGADGDELTVALAGGLQLIGFAASGSGLRARQRARVSIDAAALVVALAG